MTRLSRENREAEERFQEIRRTLFKLRLQRFEAELDFIEFLEGEALFDMDRLVSCGVWFENGEVKYAREWDEPEPRGKKKP